MEATATRVLLGLPPGHHPAATVDEVVETARLAEQAGFNGVVVSDHVVMGNRTDRYPWGRFPVPHDAPWPEPLTLLAAVAGATRVLRLATGIVIAPLRPAPLLAKTVATLDALSGGRVDLGVGAGWQQEEFEAQGLDHDQRGRLLTDTIAACRVLWGPSPGSFSSATVSFRDLWCEPKPARPGGPTVLFAGTLTPRNVRRIAEVGDGWIPIMGETPDGISAGVETLRDALAGAGRDPSTLQVRAHLPLVRGGDGAADLEQTLDGATVMAGRGVTDVVLPLGAFLRDLDDRAGWFELAAGVLAGRDGAAS
jgi:probable F420-dependent oxidoreductase